MTERQRRIRAAILRGIEWARTHGLTKDADIAICIEVELRDAGLRV